jgi:hypothetical protein
MTDAAILEVPTVHLNGPSKGELIKQLRSAMEAVHAAERALANASPHGRDYYVVGPQAIQNAMYQHRARMEKLADVARDLGYIAVRVMEQGKSRAR